MKANELMIGDWLLHETGIYVCVGTPIHERGFEAQNVRRYVEYYWLHPIPLTEEILKANGFERDRNGHYKCKKTTSLGVSLYVMIQNGVCSFDCDQYERLIFVASYVHELQHALRLCGLTELADNFKIEQV